jgi:hypothetical protein
VQKIHFLLFFILLPSLLFAQEKSLIELVSSDKLTGDLKTNVNFIRNPTFKHANATLTTDSAVLYKARNFFEAFQNVHINQGDTVNIYSDFLNYDGNTKQAHLWGNVRMVTPTSTLTTNILDYNMATKIGQYYDNGKIVNQQATIISKKGWYFANSRDAYFRYDVLVTTPTSTIKSDTLRYNTASDWAYFYGPTNIKGKDDNLYTENGAYNTKTENAYFGKKNLYTNASRSLKGDSLYYYGKKGYGRAVKNIIYIDTTDKMLLRGQLGEYYKLSERIVVTRNAYIGMDSKDSATIKNKKIPDTLWLGADTLEAQKVLQKTLTLLKRPTIISDKELGAIEEKAKQEKEKEKEVAKKSMADEEAKKKALPTTTPNKKLSKKERKKAELEAKNKPIIADSTKLLDSIKLIKQIALKDSLSKDSLAKTIKSIAKTDTTQAKKTSKQLKADKKASDAKMVNSKIALPKTSVKDTVKPFSPSDTVRVRIIKAYHNVRVYKSNMQAVADSLFFTAADSTLRWYKKPILWGESSQQTGDTIHVFFKDKKVQSFQVLQNGFIVNVEKDSTKFNQVKGKLITGLFSQGELKNMYVDGNAESIYYTKKENGEYDNMNQSLSSRIKFIFDKKELTNISMYREIEGNANPIDSLPKEPLLTGFIWKPELRPTSKADIIKGRKVAKATVKKTDVKKTAVEKGIKSTLKNLPNLNLPKGAIDSVKTVVDDVTDSVKKVLPDVKPIIDKLKVDTLKKKLELDTLKNKLLKMQ